MEKSNIRQLLLPQEINNTRTVSNPQSNTIASKSPDNYDRDLEKSWSNHQLQERYVLDVHRPVTFILTFYSYLARLFPRSLKPASKKKPSDLHSTAYLDALRGYAAWVVYNSHVINEDWRGESSYLMQWPWFKILFRGHAMVDVFFVISGYALSYRMVGFMHTQQTHRVMDSLASSMFRRYFRLFVPTAAATFVAMVLISLGIADNVVNPEVKKPTLLENFTFWVADTAQASNPFAPIVGWWHGSCLHTEWLPQLWTIPVEFRGSVVLFMFCAATCKMAPRMRMSLTWACVIAFFWWDAQYAGLFLIGMWIADMRIWRTKQQEKSSLPMLSRSSSSATLIATTPSPPSSPINKSFNAKLSSITSASSWTRMLPSHTKSLPSTSSRIRQLPYIILFFLSFYPLTSPFLIDKNTEFPYGLIARFIPPNPDQGAQIHFPLCIGAVMMVVALENSPFLQRPLLTPFSQFVGELSFGIYAMHNTVRFVVWENYLLKWQHAYWGDEANGFWQLLPGYFVLTIMVIWAAEWFRRFDMRVVHWAKALQDYCFEN